MSEERKLPSSGNPARMVTKKYRFDPLGDVLHEVLALRAEQAEFERIIETAQAEVSQCEHELGQIRNLVESFESRLTLRNEALSRLLDLASTIGVRLAQLEPELVAAIEQKGEAKRMLESRWYRTVGRVFEGLRRTVAKWRRNPLFDEEYYLSSYPDLSDAGVSPYRHFMKYGVSELRNPNPLFDTEWYLQENPDVVESGINPLWHYYLVGGKEGRDPHPLFSTAWYLKQHPEISNTEVNPLAHYFSRVQAHSQ